MTGLFYIMNLAYQIMTPVADRRSLCLVRVRPQSNTPAAAVQKRMRLSTDGPWSGWLFRYWAGFWRSWRPASPGEIAGARA